MTLKLNRAQVAHLKTLKARVAKKAAAVEAATNTATLQAALTDLTFAAHEAREITKDVERSANLDATLERAA